MIGSIKRLLRNTSFLFALFLIVLNVFVITSPLLGIVNLIVYLAALALPYGKALLPHATIWSQRATGVMSVIALLALLGSAVYYAGPVTQELLLAVTTIVGLFGMLLGFRSDTTEPDQIDPPARSSHVWLLSIMTMVAIAAWWSTFGTIQIVDSVRSVWLVVDPKAILAVGVMTFTLGLLLSTRRGSALSIPLFAISLFSVTVLAALVYPLGYGFDPFIHRATVFHIAEFGSITPKPLYYIGQYALELTALHVFALPLDIVDRLLVPLLASFMLTASAAIGFTKAMKGRRYIALLSLLLVPLGAFIVTTPQALAYTFTATLLFLSLPRLLNQEGATPLTTLGLFTAAALITHPLAGIPAAIYFTLILIATLGSGFERTRTALLSIASLAGAISLPLVFVLQSQHSGLPMTFSLGHVFDVSRLDVGFFLANRYNAWLDLLYLGYDNLLWILMIFAIIGAVFLIKAKAVKTIHLPLIAALIWFANFWLLSTTVEFSFLIEYERANYATRLLTLTALFLIPHVGVAFSFIEDRLSHKPRVLFGSFLLLVAVLVSANVYGAYPRHDNYSRSSGFNVAKVDQDAVWSINKVAEEDNYVVLANQAVSAAALEAFGFLTYYHDDIFYYPIPTGGELYQIFLEMTNDEPTRVRAEEAMNLTGVDTVYFVVNDYWWQADVIIEHAKNQADDWWAVGDGAVTIFVYERTTDDLE